MEEIEGCFNPSADAVERKDGCWSDTNLDGDYTNWKEPFQRLKCRNCGNITFEVLSTGSWETSARCCQCGMYYKVHTG